MTTVSLAFLWLLPEACYLRKLALWGSEWPTLWMARSESSIWLMNVLLRGRFLYTNLAVFCWEGMWMLGGNSQRFGLVHRWIPRQ